MCYNIRQVKMQILKLSQCSWTKRQKIKKCKTKQIIIPKCPTLERKNRDHRRDVIIINTKNHPRRDLLQLKYFSESLQNETPHNRAFLGASNGKDSSSNAEDLDLITGLGKSPGGGHGNSLQYSCLNPHGQRTLVGYSPWGHKESDTTERQST